MISRHHVPCLTSTIVVMLLVNSNSEVRNCLRIVFIFLLKRSVDIVLAMNASMLTEPMKDWKTCWLSSLLIRKRSKWLLMVSNKLLLIKNNLRYMQHLYSTVVEHFVTQQ